jgi:glycerophosphoryl diester phosphodiesterase
MKNIIVFCVLAFCVMPAIAQTRTPLPVSKHKFIVITHRGDHTMFPENTLAAYSASINDEADYTEIDLRTTKDSMLVIMHDATVDRMTNGKGRVRDLSYAEIAQLKIKGIAADSSTQYAIPAFEEVLNLCKDKIHIYLDFKDASVDQTIQLIKKHGMERQVLVYINSFAQYRDWRRIAPAMPLIVSLPDTVKSVAGMQSFIASYPAAVLDGNYNDYTPEIVAAAMAAGIMVWPDIQSKDESNNWEKALPLGFTGLQTDHPAAIIRWLKEKGKW